MRTFNRKIEYKEKTYVQKYSSTYSNRFKWRIILPEQVVIKLDDCLENNPPDFCFKREVALYFLYLVNYLSTKNKDKYYIGGYVHLNAKILRRIHKSSKKYFDYFLQEEILQVNSSYSTQKHFSKSYRYNYKQLGKLRFKIFEIDVLQRFYDKISASETTIKKGMNFLTKWLNENLTIDHEEAMLEIQTKTQYTTIEEQKTLKKAECYLQSLKNLQYHEFWASRDIGSDNRLHTNLTNMPSFFRKYVHYNNESLVGVDIKNSQPFFLILLIEELKNGIFNRDKERKEEEKRKNKIIRRNLW